MRNSYRFLSAYYDRFTGDVGYPDWAEYCVRRFREAGISPAIVLDLACGTGKLCAELAARGYDMIGVDASPEMLMRAMENTGGLTPRPLFLRQRMERLDLYGTVGACLCCLDSVNYVTNPCDLQEAFRRVELFLEPGGLFLFDVNTEEKFARMDGEAYLREDEDVYCVWQVGLDGRRCTYAFDLFERTENGLWARTGELHEERVYPRDELCEMLRKAGFVDIECRFEPTLAPVDGKNDRIFFSARKKGEWDPEAALAFGAQG